MECLVLAAEAAYNEACVAAAQALKAKAHALEVLCRAREARDLFEASQALEQAAHLFQGMEAE